MVQRGVVAYFDCAPWHFLSFQMIQNFPFSRLRRPSHRSDYPCCHCWYWTSTIHWRTLHAKMLRVVTRKCTTTSHTQKHHWYSHHYIHLLSDYRHLDPQPEIPCTLFARPPIVCAPSFRSPARRVAGPATLPLLPRASIDPDSARLGAIRPAKSTLRPAASATFVPIAPPRVACRPFRRQFLA